jgi:pimeloyl-ACP methyl ester carboxylesterase
MKTGKRIAIGLASAGAGGVAWIAYSALFIDHRRRLRPALNAELDCMESFSGGVAWYEDVRGEGVPLVLIHSVNAAASSYEMRPLFEHYRGRRPVYALDLPGFGKSERGRREYTPEVYGRALIDFVETKTASRPADVVALSLSCEFAARAAVARPELFR